MIQLNQVRLHRGSKLLFEQVSLRLETGHRLGLIGANGSGKSSLFSLLLGELEADTGEAETGAGNVIAHVAQINPSGSRRAR